MSKYTIPEDSVDEDMSSPSLKYFDKRHEIKLDEAQRNYGLSTSQISEPKQKTKTLPREASGSDEVKEIPQKSSNFGEAFAFVKETETFKSELQKAEVVGNRKRKLETSPCKQSPSKREVSAGTSGNCLVVSSRQQGNPILASFRNVAHTFSSDILPDYVMGHGICALFLSIKYHRLHPSYIYDRIKEVGNGYSVRVLLVHVDCPDSSVYIQDLSSIAVLSGFTLLLAWSPLEAARYLEAFKIYENKPAEILQGIKDNTFAGTCNNFLTSIRGVNKTDVLRLRTQFKTVKDIINSDKSKLSSIPGIGTKKADRIFDIFRTPFRTNKS